MPKKFNPHIGAANSNWKFGRPVPRTSRQAFGQDFEPPAGAADYAVLLVVVLGALLVTLIYAFGG